MASVDAAVHCFICESFRNVNSVRVELLMSSSNVSNHGKLLHGFCNDDRDRQFLMFHVQTFVTGLLLLLDTYKTLLNVFVN